MNRTVRRRAARGVVFGALLSGCGGNAVSPERPSEDASPEAIGRADGGRVASRPAEPDGRASPSACSTTSPTIPRRIIRLTFRQLLNSIGDGLGIGAMDAAARATSLDDSQFDLAFRASSREENVYRPEYLARADAMASRAGEYVATHLETTTSCGNPPTRECALAFVLAFAEKSYRRPLGDDDRADLTELLDATMNDGGSATDALQDGVYAVLSSPFFLYRTELGVGSGSTGGHVRITPFELASAVSYFMSNGPPDAQLLAAARDDRLDEAELSRQVARLLETDRVRDHLLALLGVYFRSPMVESVVLDPDVAPMFDHALASSMRRESERLLANTWQGPVRDWLTTRQTVVNADLAELYGVTVGSANRDAEGFGPVELDPSRAGILTQSAFLTGLARPNATSALQRGLAINDVFVCGARPEFPADGLANIASAPVGGTEREQAAYRASQPKCAGCHDQFDAYGLALESFDLMGRWRTVDDLGITIDTRVTLPTRLGSIPVSGAREMAEAIAQSGAFDLCFTYRFVNEALSEGPSLRTVDDCLVRTVATPRDGAALTLPRILTQIVTAQDFVTRQ